MPPALEKCVMQVMGKGKPKDSAYAICRSAMGLKADGSQDGNEVETPEEEILDKAEKMTEQMALLEAAIAKRPGVNPDRGTAEYGKVPFADEVNNKYPIDTEEHIRAAWNYINKAGNADKYPDGGAAVKRKIIAAWKKHISPDGPPSAINQDQSINQAIVRKEAVICKAVGAYVNGEQVGTLDQARLQELVDNFKKYPRQVPIYLLVGKTDPEHPTDLDKWPPDGWVEGLSVKNGDLVGDLKLHGDGASYVLGDLVRGASIQTIDGETYDGNPIGEVLQALVLTNQPYIKGLNIAATSRHQGGQKIAFIFTALSRKETVMPDPKDKKPDPLKDDGGGGESFAEKEVAYQCLLQEKDGKIRELSEQNEALLTELRERQKNTDLEASLKENRMMQRQIDALRIRQLVAKGEQDGQFVRDQILGYEGGPDQSDEVTLAWFKSSQFKGKLELLRYHLKTFPKKTMGRTYRSGADSDAPEPFTEEEQAQLRDAGKDPEVIAATRGARNFTDYKRRKAAVQKGA